MVERLYLNDCQPAVLCGMLPSLWRKAPWWICRAATAMCNLCKKCVRARAVWECARARAGFPEWKVQWRRTFCWNDAILLSPVSSTQSGGHADNGHVEAAWIKDDGTVLPCAANKSHPECKCVCVLASHHLACLSACSTCPQPSLLWHALQRRGPSLLSHVHAKTYMVHKNSLKKPLPSILVRLSKSPSSSVVYWSCAANWARKITVMGVCFAFTAMAAYKLFISPLFAVFYL